MVPIVLSGNKEQSPQLVEAANHNGPDQDQQNLELASDSTALKEQMTRMESGGEEENMRIQKGLKVKNKDRDEELTAKLHSHIAELASENAVLVEQLLMEVDEKVESFMRMQELEENIKLLTQNNPDLQVQFLQSPSKLLKEFKDHNAKLASENASLKEQLATKENELRVTEQFWTRERGRVSALWEDKIAKVSEIWKKDLKKASVEKKLLAKSLQEESDRKVSQVVLEKDEVIAQLTEAIEALKFQNLERETQLEEKERQLIQSEEDHNTKLAALEADLKTKEKEYQEQIHSLSHHLDEKENELRLAEQFWTRERYRVSSLWIAKVSEFWERDLEKASVEKKLLAKSLQEESDRKVSQVILEKDEVIAQMTAAIEALKVQNLERETQLEEKERQLIQSEEDHYTKLAALESDLRSQLASQEETIEELRRNASDMEQHWTNQMSFMKDQIQVLNTPTLQARVLQESIQENMTSEELKAQKKNLKRLIKEKEEEEKRQKKESDRREKMEKKEKEKREKEELKRLKKERQEGE